MGCGWDGEDEEICRGWEEKGRGRWYREWIRCCGSGAEVVGTGRARLGLGLT